MEEMLGGLKGIKLNNTQKNIALVLSAYGIIQVLAQDLGIKTGKKQRDLVQKLPVQVALFFSAAFMVTGDFYLSLITISIYFGLKYYYSKGETSPVCFEDV
jgi:hypothetical protein